MSRPPILAKLISVCAGVAVAGVGLVSVPAQAQPVPIRPATDSASPRFVGADARAGVVVVRGVPVTKASVSGNGRVVTARVLWNQAMIARKGQRDRFNIRLVAFPAGGRAPVVLSRWSKPKPKAKNQPVNIKLSKRNAKVLRSSTDAVLSVSQQYGTPRSKLYGRNYVTVKHLNFNTGRTSSKAVGRISCQRREIVPGVNRSRCDQAGADLTRANLSGVNFSGANLRSNVLTHANMSGAIVTGAISGGIEGQPNPPPTGWHVVNGVLVPTSGGGGGGAPPAPAPAPVSCAAGGGAANTCVLGNVGPGGGRVFYVNEANTAGSKYLEAAPTDWNGSGADPGVPWCATVSVISGVETIATSAASVIGTGQANTTAIDAGCATTGSAAKRANDYTSPAPNSKTDWFLPSEAELNQLCKYARSYNSSGAALVPAVQTGAVCDSGGTLVGGFAAAGYWSSSQNVASGAWGQDFGNGNQGLGGKSFALRVRPVRAF